MEKKGKRIFSHKNQKTLRCENVEIKINLKHLNTKPPQKCAFFFWFESSAENKTGKNNNFTDKVR